MEVPVELGQFDAQRPRFGPDSNPKGIPLLLFDRPFEGHLESAPETGAQVVTSSPRRQERSR